jgi:hypothetical protein
MFVIINIWVSIITYREKSIPKKYGFFMTKVGNAGVAQHRLTKGYIFFIPFPHLQHLLHCFAD